jgi:anti-sigma B factor antagonist
VLDFFVFGSLFLRQLWLMKVRHSLPATVPVTEEIIINGIGMLHASGAITIQNHSVLMERASHLLTQTSQLIIDLSDVTFMDSTAIGTVVHLTKELRAAGGDLYLVNAQDPIRMTFQFLYLEHYVNLKKHWGDVVYPNARQAKTAAQAIDPAATRQTMDLDGKHWQVVRLPLRFDATSAEAIRLKCGPILESSSNLALDCSETTLLTSAGLSVISELYHKSTGTQSSIMLLDANKDVLKVLRMVKFDQFLSIKNITS